jgi:hypothetical protein
VGTAIKDISGGFIMVISSNTLFHFTSNMDNLLNILTNEFRPRYCLENWSNLFIETGEFQQAFPMVCFCDLPISQLNEHLKFYGNYGIGMKKEWGIKNRINPVLYLHSKSSLATSIAVLMKSSFEGEDKQIYVFESIFELTNYVKLYEGYVIRNGKKIFKRFYDEKEWRWIPKRVKDRKINLNFLMAQEFNTPEKREAANAAIFDYDRLSFDPDDIKYIIVSKEEEILPMIKNLEKIKEKYDNDTVQRLTSRIISAEHIRADF